MKRVSGFRRALGVSGRLFVVIVPAIGVFFFSACIRLEEHRKRGCSRPSARGHGVQSRDMVAPSVSRRAMEFWLGLTPRFVARVQATMPVPWVTVMGRSKRASNQGVTHREDGDTSSYQVVSEGECSFGVWKPGKVESAYEGVKILHTRQTGDSCGHGAASCLAKARQYVRSEMGRQMVLVLPRPFDGAAALGPWHGVTELVLGGVGWSGCLCTSVSASQAVEVLHMLPDVTRLSVKLERPTVAFWQELISHSKLEHVYVEWTESASCKGVGSLRSLGHHLGSLTLVARSMPGCLVSKLAAIFRPRALSAHQVDLTGQELNVIAKASRLDELSLGGSLNADASSCQRIGLQAESIFLNLVGKGHLAGRVAGCVADIVAGALRRQGRLQVLSTSTAVIEQTIRALAGQTVTVDGLLAFDDTGREGIPCDALQALHPRLLTLFAPGSNERIQRCLVSMKSLLGLKWYRHRPVRSGSSVFNDRLVWWGVGDISRILRQRGRFPRCATASEIRLVTPSGPDPTDWTCAPMRRTVVDLTRALRRAAR